jgi:hypothetical protein
MACLLGAAPMRMAFLEIPPIPPASLGSNGLARVPFRHTRRAEPAGGIKST